MSALTVDDRARTRFWARVDTSTTPDGCWPWTGRPNGEGRGRFTADGMTDYAYRWALRMGGTEVGPGVSVRHLCGRPACVRPDHLDHEGGQRENNLDTVGHGRNRSAKLDHESVRRIRERAAAPDAPALAVLAHEYGVSASAVSAVVRGKSWTRAGGPIRKGHRGRAPPSACHSGSTDGPSSWSLGFSGSL